MLISTNSRARTASHNALIDDTSRRPTRDGHRKNVQETSTNGSPSSSTSSSSIKLTLSILGMCKPVQALPLHPFKRCPCRSILCHHIATPASTTLARTLRPSHTCDMQCRKSPNSSEASITHARLPAAPLRRAGGHGHTSGGRTSQMLMLAFGCHENEAFLCHQASAYQTRNKCRTRPTVHCILLCAQRS